MSPEPRRGLRPGWDLSPERPEPGAGAWSPETWDLRPEPWDLRPEPWDLRPEPWDLRLETWDLSSGA